jgi:DNA adenine methylase
MRHLPLKQDIAAYFIEPFVGSGAVFFRLNPKKAILADVNAELINLYRGLRLHPGKVWEIFSSLPRTKGGYYRIRNDKNWPSDLASQAARTLYLNRTCFKGMWRHNAEGQFNVGYGGQDRRRVVSKEILLEVAKRLRKALLRTGDFEDIIELSTAKDFLFLDPPYRPGKRELLHAHYTHSRFTYSDHKRLARALKRAARRGVRWAMTISAHSDIVSKYAGNRIVRLTKSKKRKQEDVCAGSGEVLVLNF